MEIFVIDAETKDKHNEDSSRKYFYRKKYRKVKRIPVLIPIVVPMGKNVEFKNSHSHDGKSFLKINVN